MAAVALDDAALLDAWERSLGFGRPWRELALLEAAGSGVPEGLARLPLGARDALLLALRERAFGRRIEAEASCAACAERLELELDTATLAAPPDAPALGPAEVEHDGWSVVFRAPDSVALAASRDAPADAETALLEGCVERAARDGAPVAASALPAHVRELVAAGMAELDPGAELLIDVACPACGQRGQLLFDPAAFVLAELDAHADSLLSDVDQLARAYGWREADVLSLTPHRRRLYLELVAP